MTKPLLQVVIASTRPTRVGDKVADWFIPIAEAHGAFNVERVDLRELDLPMFDEPKHPRLGEYEYEHTKRWSETVSRADAFAFVTPEYDFGPPASLVNALQYLVKEWAYKPAGLVTYGGVSAGLRSANALRIMTTALNMMPLPGAVSIPMVTNLITKETGAFEPPELQDRAAQSMLTELARWETAMRTLRTPAPAPGQTAQLAAHR